MTVKQASARITKNIMEKLGPQLALTHELIHLIETYPALDACACYELGQMCWSCQAKRLLTKARKK